MVGKGGVLKIQLTTEFKDVPIVEITEERYLKLLDSIHLFTLDKYLKSWIMVKREIGMIINVVGKEDEIIYIQPRARLKLI